MRDATYDPLVRRKRRRRTSWLRRVTRRPRHFVRKHRALSVIVAVALVLLLILLLFLWFLNRKLDDVPRFDVDLGGNRPYVAGGTNILIAGVDDGHDTELTEALQAGEWPQGVFRSDAIMVVHISEDWSKAQVVSIPRDSYVPVEGHGRTKINAAFSFGGPSLLARTVEDVTDLRIDHVMVTDFEGFKGITTTIGGVMVFIPEDSVDERSPLKPGWHRLEGDNALVYVRQRYGLTRGDFDRVQRQQNVLRAILERSTRWSILANPLRVTRLVDDIAANLAVDSSLTTGKLRELGLNARNLGLDDVAFMTAPNAGSATIDGASVVKLKPAQVRALFEAISHDDFAKYVAEHPVEILPPAQEVK